MLFNAQHAAPGRARRQAAWIAAQENADLVIVTGSASRRAGADRGPGRARVLFGAGLRACRT